MNDIPSAQSYIEEYEHEHGVSYDQVVITRPDIAFFSPILPPTGRGSIHVPSGEGFDECGRKHNGNARVLYYKNVVTGDLVPGGDTITFNDQIFVTARQNLACFSGLTKALSEYLIEKVPPSPETILYLHLCIRHALKPVIHPEWCYQILRAGVPLAENVADTSIIGAIDRYHAKAREQLSVIRWGGC